MIGVHLTRWIHIYGQLGYLLKMSLQEAFDVV